MTFHDRLTQIFYAPIVLRATPIESPVACSIADFRIHPVRNFSVFVTSWLRALVTHRQRCIPYRLVVNPGCALLRLVTAGR